LIIYTVKAGDSIYSISRRFGVSSEVIVTANQIANPNVVVIGQALVIPVDYVQHRVVAGESLYSIARRYGTTVDRILSLITSITTPSRIYIGQIILVPTSSILRKIDVNGYAFPSISSDTLRRTLPNLTYMSPFSYQVRGDGSLVPINDNTMIEMARQQRAAPMMIITNIGEAGGFSSELANTILTNPQIQNTLINNITNILRNKNYYGLGIDFEYIYQTDRENYNNFLRNVVSRLRPLGYTITTALAPKISGSQQGLLYTAHDYPVHGELADHVILMTYEWGYTYSPARAVAPLDQVERVLNYAVSVIPRNKILMGIPNYGYNWTLPFVQGSAARTISNTAAVNLAGEVRAQIQFDPIAASPYFNYTDSAGRRHTVRFEDARSIEAKLKLVNKYGLAGVSYWTINNFFSQNWLVLQSMYEVNKLL
jgi:spore germination protein